MIERDAQPTGMDETDIHDPAMALELAGGDAELAADLMEALLAGLPEEIESLRACLAEADWPGLADHAHQVCGATRYCAVPALDTAIAALERAARLSDADRCQDCFAMVELQSRRLLEQSRHCAEPARD